MANGIPAWLVCTELLDKARRELVAEAMDALDEEERLGNIEVKGGLVELPERPNDTDAKLFIIGRLIEAKDEMLRGYARYVSGIESKKGASPEEVEAASRARRFMLGIEKISTLMGYADALDAWVREIGANAGDSDPVRLLAMTAGHGRVEALEFIVKSRGFAKERVLSDFEMGVIREALAKVG
jgi:hypothetical protein